MPSIAQAPHMDDVVSPNQHQNPLKRRREDKLVRWVVHNCFVDLVPCSLLDLYTLLLREDGNKNVD